MDYNINEITLKAQCENFNRLIRLIDQISICDHELLKLSMQRIPNTDRISLVTNKKESLINDLDLFSKHIVHNDSQILEALSNVPSLQSHPKYIELINLQKIATSSLDQLLCTEDNNNPSIINKLSLYRERLALDYAISKVPPEARQTFLIRL